MTINDYMLWVRSVIYLWTAVQFLLLGTIYQFGYESYRKTKIIATLKNTFLTIALAFFFLAFLPFISEHKLEIYKILKHIFAIIILVAGIYAAKFRKCSLEDEKIDLPNSKENKNGGD